MKRERRQTTSLRLAKSTFALLNEATRKTQKTRTEVIEQCIVRQLHPEAAK